MIDHDMTFEKSKKVKMNKLTKQQMKTILSNIPRPKNADIFEKLKNRKIIKFNCVYYEKYDWMACCIVKKVLYCYKCVFTGNKSSAWCINGFKSISCIKKMADSHQDSKDHLHSCIEINISSKHTILELLDKNKKKMDEETNKKIDKNMRYLTSLIRIILFLEKQGLSLRENIKNIDSNKGNFVELVDFMTHDNSILKEFQIIRKNLYLSPQIQNELLDSIDTVLSEDIINELMKCRYISVISDETTDVSKKTQLVIVFKYMINNNIKERFINMIDVSSGKNSREISNKILGTIKDLKIEKKNNYTML